MGSEENMKVCVYGLGHLGSVTAACLASVGHEVTGIDLMEYPSGEPGLSDMMGPILIGPGKADAIPRADILWVTFDTPVDDNDRADVDFVLGKIREIMPMVSESTPVVISSQLPVGTIRNLEGDFPRHTFVCIPENLRHGTAVENFLHPDRFVVGIRSKEAGEKIIPLLNFATIEWMSIESAEMTKHAINSFLAMSICFINEIADVCEKTGADPGEVERGLKSEERIGRKAYLKPGKPYSGGTLARDVEYLRRIEIDNNLYTPVIDAIQSSNYVRGHISIHGSLEIKKEEIGRTE
jgi:UDPglucose 6-dehydrogenase